MATTVSVTAPAPTRVPVLAGAAALVTVAAWASAFIGIRVAPEDIPPGALGVARQRQTNKEGYAERVEEQRGEKP